MRKLYSPSYGLLHDVVPINKGGTSSKTPEEAATALGLLTNPLVGANNGVATLTGNYLTESQLPALGKSGTPADADYIEKGVIAFKSGGVVTRVGVLMGPGEKVVVKSTAADTVVRVGVREFTNAV